MTGSGGNIQLHLHSGHKQLINRARIRRVARVLRSSPPDRLSGVFQADTRDDGFIERSESIKSTSKALEPACYVPNVCALTWWRSPFSSPPSSHPLASWLFCSRLPRMHIFFFLFPRTAFRFLGPLLLSSFFGKPPSWGWAIPPPLLKTSRNVYDLRLSTHNENKPKAKIIIREKQTKNTQVEK